MFRCTLASGHVPHGIEQEGDQLNQLHRTLGVTLETAWFVSHRIRAALQTVGLEPMDGAGSIVEADETYIGRLDGDAGKHNQKGAPLIRMSSYRARASARSFHIDSASTANIEKIMRENIRKESRLMTDEGRHYKPIGRDQT